VAFKVVATGGDLKVVLYRGERMCLIGMDMSPKPGPDFVGFAIEVKAPDATDFEFLKNRLAFSYPPGGGVTGNRDHPTNEAPLQTFRWIHFPWKPQTGAYTYRVTAMTMDATGVLKAGDSVTAQIILFDATLPGFVDVGFTKNFASSQAFTDAFPDEASRNLILPASGKDGIGFDKSKAPPGVYAWLAGKANDLLWALLDEAENNDDATLDVLAYDLNEPDVVSALEKVAKRGTAQSPSLRIVIDNSADHADHDSSESIAAARLQTAGAVVVRHHFKSLQHNKVMVLKRNGVLVRAICGSTNFSFRGLYIQANNMLSFTAPTMVKLVDDMVQLALKGPTALPADPLSQAWQAASTDDANARICFSPHPHNSDLSLTPLEGAIEQASSSVLYAIAFLAQDTKGPIRKAMDRLVGKPLFSYGIVDKEGKLSINKPDGTEGVVDFAYLSAHAPVPFSGEWSGGQGITIHHKYVVVDFNLPTAKVFCGSSNLSLSGEENNGDHLIQISDPRVAVAYAVEALRMFDHLRFRTKMKEAGVPKKGEAAAPGAGTITLAKPPPAGQDAWFEPFYKPDTQKLRDRVLFSS